MNSKTITLAVMFLIVGIVMVLPSEETIKPTTSQKDKVLKSQGILLAALAIIGIL
jgi:preprotein translocase subunit SecG